MPARLPGSAWAPRAALIAALLPLLADCGPARNEFAPSCPGTAILGDAADFSAYRGPGRDLTDLVLQARIVSVSGNCKKGDDKEHLAVVVSDFGVDRHARSGAAGGGGENVQIQRHVVHPARGAHYAARLSCRQRPRCRMKRRPAFRSP